MYLRTENKLTEETDKFICECPQGTAFSGQFCENVLNHCDSDPCYFHGKHESLCKPTCLNKPELNAYECLCGIHFKNAPGQTDCAQKIDPCDTTPCYKGSTCTEDTEEHTFKCDCSPCVTGEFCEKPLQEVFFFENNVQIILHIYQIVKFSRFFLKQKNLKSEIFS